MPLAFLPTPWRTLSALALAAALSACGGGDVDELPQATAAATTLLDDEGAAMPSVPGAEPPDPRARTEARRYATQAQAEQLESALGNGLVIVTVEPAGDPVAAVDLAVMGAYAWQAAHDLDASAPVVVRGDDLVRAAQVADRLSTHGFDRVFLVTQ